MTDNPVHLVTYREPTFSRERVGLLRGDKIVDLTLAHTRLLHTNHVPAPDVLAESMTPPNMIRLLEGGDRTTAAVRDTADFLDKLDVAGDAIVGARGETIAFDRAAVKLLAPIPRPGKIVHTAGNFREHAREGTEAGWDFPIPQWISFIKCSSVVIADGDPIIHPPFTRKLDHEIEIGIVIGKAGRFIDEDDAWDHIAGFTVFNDITARDVQHKEMSTGLINLGKNFESFAPLGPSMVLRDDVGDVHNLDIELRVNGEPRQVSNTDHLSVSIPQIVAHWSVMHLDPGDIISTGTVAGVAAYRTPDPTPYFLKPGDLLEAEVENIGVLRNEVIEQELTEQQQAWVDARRHLFFEEKA